MTEHIGVPTRFHQAMHDAYLEGLRVTDPKLQLIWKRDSRLCKVIDKTLKVITFGGQDRFMSSFVTTLGSRIYLPEGWDEVPAGRRLAVLRHEIIHVRQFQRFTWPGMVLLYLLLPLPVVFAAGRSWLELEAYKETLKATWQISGRDAAWDEGMRKHIVERFTGPDYAWMWLPGGMIDRRLVAELERLDADPPPPLHYEGDAEST